MEITYQQIIKDAEINLLLSKGNDVLGVLGYTDHSQAHAAFVAERAAKLLKELDYSEKTIELTKIAGYMHDIGNSINRHNHAINGALLAFQILKERHMLLEDVITVSGAIGQHDEGTGTAVDAVSAALILADKTDVRRNRVRNKIRENFDVHDRVNYAALATKLIVLKDQKIIQMDLTMDDSICSVMDYFEIFLERMVMCKRAAEILGYKFQLVANGTKVA